MKSKINYKLVNILLIIIIIFFLLKLEPFFKIIYKNLNKIFLPFIISFLLATLIIKIKDIIKKSAINNKLAFLIFISFFFLIGISIYFLLPKIINQLSQLIISFVKYIIKSNFSHEIKSYFLQNTEIILKKLINISKYTILNFLSILKNFILIFILTIYFCCTYQKNKLFIKNKIKNKKILFFLQIFNNESTNYFKGILTISIITLFEYTIIYFASRHPYFLFLGILSAISTFIPLFGITITYIIALVTALSVSNKLFFITLFLIIIVSIIDNYIIDPKILRKTNKINFLETIFVLFIGNYIFNIFGLIISIPLYNAMKKYFYIKNNNNML